MARKPRTTTRANADPVFDQPAAADGGWGEAEDDDDEYTSPQQGLGCKKGKVNRPMPRAQDDEAKDKAEDEGSDHDDSCVITQKDLARLRQLRDEQYELRALRHKLIRLHRRGARHEPGRLRLVVEPHERRYFTRRIVGYLLNEALADWLWARIPPTRVDYVHVEDKPFFQWRNPRTK
jgi:hypothetical protein